LQNLFSQQSIDDDANVIWCFSRLGKELVEELRTTDLFVIEGMGRAVHTNLDAKFTCDSLKIAVIKNPWLAKRLGGEMFSVICKFEIPPKNI